MREPLTNTGRKTNVKKYPKIGNISNEKKVRVEWGSAAIVIRRRATLVNYNE